MKNFKKGFTLIELLVVVAIIGILASVVLASLSSARTKGADAAVKSNLNTIRSQSELFFSNNGNSFLPIGGSTTATCPTSCAIGSSNMFFSDKIICNAIAEATKRGGNGNSCYNSSSVWAVAVGLKSSTTTSWCVDSGGMSKQVNFNPGHSIDQTTHFCL